MEKNFLKRSLFISNLNNFRKRYNSLLQKSVCLQTAFVIETQVFEDRP
jgi:hypothetical protein